MQISFIILFMIDLYTDNHVRACVRACVCAFVNFKKKKKNFSETIDWTFTKFHSSVPQIEIKIVTEKSGLWSDTGAQAPLVSNFSYSCFNRGTGLSKNLIQNCVKLMSGFCA